MTRSTLSERMWFCGRVFLAWLVVLTVPAATVRGQNTGRVFAILVIDTDANIAGLEDDARGMTAALETGFGRTNLLQLRILEGADVSPGAIVNLIRSAPLGPNDALLVYYTGHGATVEGRGHVLTTSRGALARSDLRAVMDQRKPRLSVLLSDCCSSLVRPRKEPPQVGAPAPPPEVSPMLRCLLLQHRGVVDVTSSSFGEASWSKQGTGGFFTNALVSALGSWNIDAFDADQDGFATWMEVFDHVRHETQATFRAFKQDVFDLDPAQVDAKLLASLKAQRDQVPQAFALGEAQRAIVRTEFFAPNIGIHYQMVPVDNQLGARLTRDPAAGTGAAQLRLEEGDTIYNLDGLPIRAAVDVMNHHGRTDVSFINVRNGQRQAGVMNLAPYTPLPPEVPREHHAANFGMHYQLMAYEGDTLGARVSRTASGNTPAASIGLERGDMIIRIDGEPIRAPEDVLNHILRTTVEFINIRTGKMETRVVQLPGQGGR